MITEQKCELCGGTGHRDVRNAFVADHCPACLGSGSVLVQREAPAPLVERHACRPRTECCCDPYAADPATFCPEHGNGTDRPRCSCGRYAPYLTRDEKAVDTP